MNHILFTTLLFANSVFASAFQTSLVGLKDVPNTSIQKTNFKVSGNPSRDFNLFEGSIEKVSLHTQDQCFIRPSNALEKELYSGVVAVDIMGAGGTGQFVFNDDLGVSESDSRFVLTALHGLREGGKGKLAPIDPVTGKINPKLAKVHVRGCEKDQKVTSVCTAPNNLNDPNNDYVFLVLEKSDCRARVQPLHLHKIEKQEAKGCKQVHVAQVLSPGIECGTAADRHSLSEYNAAAGPIDRRNLFLGDGGVYNVNQGNDYMFYHSDTAGGASGGAVICDNGNYTGTLLAIHSGDGTNGTNQGLMIHQGMTETLKRCADQVRLK